MDNDRFDATDPHAEVMTEHGPVRPNRFFYDDPSQIRVVSLPHDHDGEDDDA